MEYNTREGRTKCIGKDVGGGVQAVVGKKKFLVQFEDGQKRDPHPKSTMSSPFVTITYSMKEKRRIKSKIGVGSIVKENSRKMEENTPEGRIRRMRKEVVGCVHDMVGKKKLLVQFEYGQKKEISSSLLVFLNFERGG